MKIHLEYHGAVFEFERHPMSESRFKAVCRLAAAWVYAGMVAVVTALCGISGLIAAAISSVVALALIVVERQ